jgi:preprotein translocase subunit SecA
VVEVNALEPKFKAMSDDELKGQTAIFKARLAKGESLQSIQAEAFAVCREASRRVLGMRHFDVQVIGGAILNDGKIAEMRTGEGKTLVATLPAYLNALTGKGVHVVTVNDYLARRDSEWMGRLYSFLGLSVGVVLHGMNEEQKIAAYAADITYGQNNEFGFDFLRDNMKFSASEIAQRAHYFAIVDEVDSILIDEARTPLIISGPAEDSTELYAAINKIVPRLSKDKDFTQDEKSKTPTLTEDGIKNVEGLLGVENLYDPQNIQLLHHVNQGLKAYVMFQRDVDYVVREGQVVIVDEFTGRLQPGRRWSDGLHQAIEAKEGLRIQRENRTLASVTFQNYFRMYEKLSGMTGTADTEAAEFRQIYNLEVVSIPTNRAMVRADGSDKVYRTRKEKYEAVVEDIAETHQKGQPVLVGTISIEQSEELAKLLTKKGVKHNVLNAKQHEREAEIIAQAGRFGAVTISTNMAGRGTDILLGGNAEFMAAAEAKTKDATSPEYQAALVKYSKQCEEERAKVVAAGGLYVLGTERHESRRIDNQLRGRAGRQGDPGKSTFYVGMDDDLMRRFGGDRIQAIMQRLGWEDGAALDGGIISRTVETAQKRVEGFHFEIRKHLIDYDNVMNRQRQIIYALRSKILRNQNLREEILSAMDDALEEQVLQLCDERSKPSEWKLKDLSERVEFLTKLKINLGDKSFTEQQEIFDIVRTAVHSGYANQVSAQEKKLSEIRELSARPEMPFSISISRVQGKPLEFATVEQDTFLETLDHFWNDHLTSMDHLREGIGLRGYSQKNPLHEYQKEGFLLFQRMLGAMKETVLRRLFFYEVPEPAELIKGIQADQERRAAAAKDAKKGQKAAEKLE